MSPSSEEGVLCLFWDQLDLSVDEWTITIKSSLVSYNST